MAGNYRVRGLETSARARASALTLDAGVAWNHSEMVKEASVFLGGRNTDRFQLAANLHRTKTRESCGYDRQLTRRGARVPGNSAARYEIDFDAYRAFAQIASCISRIHCRPRIGSLSTRRANQSLTPCRPSPPTMPRSVRKTLDGSCRSTERILTNMRAELFANDSLGYKAVTVNRPDPSVCASAISSTAGCSSRCSGDDRFVGQQRRPFHPRDTCGIGDVSRPSTAIKPPNRREP